MSNSQDDGQRPGPPWSLVVAGVLGLAAASFWLVGTYYFWYYQPFLPALGSIVFGVAAVLAWRGRSTARIIATVTGVLQSFLYGPDGLVAVVLCLASLVLLYLPPSNAYFRRRSEADVQPD